MKSSWIYKQALLMFISEMKDFELLYEKQDAEKIQSFLKDFVTLPESFKRQMIIDTKISYESKD